MKIQFFILGAAIAVLVPANPAFAKTTRLQTVNITERHLSLEGGEARLYRVSDARRTYCRIEVIHLGEMGRLIEVFDFGPKLFAAERTEYRYNEYFTDPALEETVAERTTLKSSEGRTMLSQDFEEARTFFDAHRLAKCSGK